MKTQKVFAFFGSFLLSFDEKKMFQAQTKSFDDDFDTDSEDEIPAQKSVSKKGEPVKNEDDEDDSDFEDPDLIEIPGGGRNLNTLKSGGDAGPSSMPLFGKWTCLCLLYK